MSVINGVRLFLKCRGALQLQAAYKTPVNAFAGTSRLWFERVAFNETPVKADVHGLNANNWESTAGRAIKRFEPWIELHGRATPTFLLAALPAISGAAFAGNVLGFSPATKYLSFGFRDADAGTVNSQAWRFADCVATSLKLESASHGELMYTLTLLPEAILREPLNATVISIPQDMTDLERFNHRAGQPLVRDPAGLNVPVATGRVEIELVQKIKAHYGPSLYPVIFKAGHSAVRGNIRGRFSDEYKAIREDALAMTYRRFIQTWATAAGAKTLAVDLKNVDFVPSNVEADGRKVSEFAAEMVSYSDGTADPVVITKGGF